MIDVTIILVDGGLPSTSIAPLEIFACAGSLWGELTGGAATPRFRVRTASVDGRKRKTYLPLMLEPTRALADIRKTDLVVVPAVGMDVDAAPEMHRAVVDWLARRRPTTAVAAICSGVVLLAAAGLLDGRPATTHWALVDRCRALYPRVRWKADRFVTEADNLFCAGGVYASIDLSLYLVEHYCGHEVAVQTAKALLLHTPRTWQAPYATQPPRTAHEDAAIRRAQRMLVRNLRSPVDIDGLAARAGMSPRHFARRFRAATGEAPLTYLHRLRIDRARHYLEQAHRSVEEISQAVGYEDVAFFRRLFRRHAGVAPREYRARFGPAARRRGG